MFWFGSDPDVSSLTSSGFTQTQEHFQPKMNRMGSVPGGFTSWLYHDITDLSLVPDWCQLHCSLRETMKNQTQTQHVAVVSPLMNKMKKALQRGRLMTDVPDIYTVIRRLTTSRTDVSIKTLKCFLSFLGDISSVRRRRCVGFSVSPSSPVDFNKEEYQLLLHET